MYFNVYIKRREAQKTQEQVAKVLGIHTDSYRLKEKGRYEFTVREAKKLSDLFNCTMDELFSEVA